MRNRTEGHNWERKCVKLLKHIFPFIVTSRSESKSRDDMGIDLINLQEYVNGPLPLEFQCKSTAKHVKYKNIFDKMPGIFPKVILHKLTEKRGKRFYEVGQYAILDLDTFIKLLDGSIKFNSGEESQDQPIKAKKDKR
jgi:hypothetical protein